MRASITISAVLAGLVTLTTAFPPFGPHHNPDPDASVTQHVPPSAWPNITISTPCMTEVSSVKPISSTGAVSTVQFTPPSIGPVLSMSKPHANETFSSKSIVTITVTETLSGAPVDTPTNTISPGTSPDFSIVFPSNVLYRNVTITSSASVKIPTTQPISSIFGQISSLLGDATSEIATKTTSTINTLVTSPTPVASILSDISSRLGTASSEIATKTAPANISAVIPTGLNNKDVSPSDDGSVCECSILPPEDKLCTRDCECCADWGEEACCCFTEAIDGVLPLGGLGFCSTACCHADRQ